MLDFKPKVAAALALLLIIAFVAPALAAEYNPGVSAGQYVKYGNYYGVNMSPEGEQAGVVVFGWQKVEVIAVSGKEVTLLATGQYKNGTTLPNQGITVHNLETGETNESHSYLKSIIPSDLNEGDTIPPGTFAVNKTEIRNYLGVSRVVNVLTEEISLPPITVTRLTVVYDRASGMAMEYETLWMNSTNGGVRSVFDYSVTDTNIFQVTHSPASIPVEAFYALGAVAIAVPVTTAVVLKKRKPETKNRALEQKVIDLTYNLSGVNRGECYLADSLERCAKIVCDLHARGVSALTIVREDPELLTKNCNLKPDDVVLLSSQPIKGFKAINSLQEISIAISKFIKAGGGVVLLDGLEYLVSRAGFNTVYMMLQEKHIEFLEAGSVLLIPVNMETLDSREKGQLLSELKLL